MATKTTTTPAVVTPPAAPQPQFRVKFNSATKTVEGHWISPTGKVKSAFKSVSGRDGKFGIEGEVYSPMPIDFK